MDDKEAIESVGALLTAYLKSGPQPGSAEQTEAQIVGIIEASVTTPADSTREYGRRCDALVKTVIKARRLPVREIGSDELYATAKGAAKTPEVSLSTLSEQYKLCVENYEKQSKQYFVSELEQLRAMLLRFLRHVPIGGSSDKALKREITEIKKSFRDLTKWERLFSTIKAGSFAAALDRTFTLEGNPLAATWHYSPMDEAGEFRNAYSHKDHDGRVYCIRDNWALKKGFMIPGPDGYIEDIPQPGEEFDCMCNYVWTYNLGSLPEHMLTPKGKTALEQAKREVAKLPGRNT